MARTKEELLKAFQEDHAVLGRGFHQISTCLRAGDLAGAKAVATALDDDAGAHIAFEERHFYPALVPLLGEGHVMAMLGEHRQGAEVIRALGPGSAQAPLGDDRRCELLRASEAMERHIAECGELFEAMGRIAESEQAELLDKLQALRAEHPSWTAEVDSRREDR